MFNFCTLSILEDAPAYLLEMLYNITDSNALLPAIHSLNYDNITHSSLLHVPTVPSIQTPFISSTQTPFTVVSSTTETQVTIDSSDNNISTISDLDNNKINITELTNRETKVDNSVNSTDNRLLKVFEEYNLNLNDLEKQLINCTVLLYKILSTLEVTLGNLKEINSMSQFTWYFTATGLQRTHSTHHASYVNPLVGLKGSITRDLGIIAYQVNGLVGLLNGSRPINTKQEPQWRHMFKTDSGKTACFFLTPPTLTNV